jgi:hypothetical protein
MNHTLTIGQWLLVVALSALVLHTRDLLRRHR